MHLWLNNPLSSRQSIQIREDQDQDSEPNCSLITWRTELQYANTKRSQDPHFSLHETTLYSHTVPNEL